MKHTKGKVVTIDKPHDDHDNFGAVVQDSFVHKPSKRTIYRVTVKKNGIEESRHFNEGYLK